MPQLENYQEFAGRHHETGTLRDALAWAGARVPHTGEPPSEALLLGISGGIAFGYFTFHYQGYPPHLVLLSRNTFDPLATLYERLAIPRDLRQTGSATKGVDNLRSALDEGHAAIVEADAFGLPWTLLPPDERNWGMIPLLVYGLDEENAWIAGPSSQPLVIPAATLHEARGRVKKAKYRVNHPRRARLQPPGNRGRGGPAPVPRALYPAAAARQPPQLRPRRPRALGPAADQHAQQAGLAALLRPGP